MELLGPPAERGAQLIGTGAAFDPELAVQVVPGQQDRHVTILVCRSRGGPSERPVVSPVQASPRRVAPCAEATAAMAASRRDPTSASVSVRSGAR